MNFSHNGQEKRGSRPLRRVACAILALFVVIMIPTSPESARPAAFAALPLALPVLILLAALGRNSWQRLSVGAASTLIFAVVILKIADALTLFAFARPFNGFLHLPLTIDGMRFLASAVGAVGAAGILVAALVAIAGLGFIVYRLTRCFNDPRIPSARNISLISGGILLTVWAGLSVTGARGGSGPIARDNVFVPLSSRVAEHLEMSRDIPIFRAALSNDPYARIDADRRLARLEGTDFLVLFIESYGRGTIESPHFATRMQSLLEGFEKKIDGHGLTSASGWIRSTTYGGQSWLAHSSLLSGLPIDRPSRYDALLLSTRTSLARDFGATGRRTVFVNPAIVRPWPESKFYGFDRTYTADALSYRGRAIHYMTMPDQFTLSALYDRELSPSAPRSSFAAIALISSHAPWTPIPKIKPWAEIGDGSSFDARAFSGAAPERVWSDIRLIRQYYADSIAYVLRTIESFLTERLRGNALVVILGDHQPLPFVTGNAPTRDVPVHVVSRNGELVRMLGSGWLSPGMQPAAGTAALPIEDFRGRLIETFTPGRAGRHARTDRDAPARKLDP